MIKSEFGNFFEDFVVSDVIKHSLTKTIFESDNNLFSLLTMNHHPVHLNLSYAEANQHGKILVVGTLVFSLVVGITVPDISGKAIANLGYNNVRHLAPVFLNDSLRAETEVLGSSRSKSKPDRGIIEVRTIAYNQNDLAVISFERKILIKSKHQYE